MYKYAQILDGKVHWIMEHGVDLDTLYKDYFNINDVTFVDITNISPQPQEGWKYDTTTETFSETLVVLKSEAEKLATYKEQRDVLLKATDTSYACDDYTIAGQPITTEQRQELKVYRQALRDAPTTVYPEFPIKPSWL